jgi:hypothetical protein
MVVLFRCLCAVWFSLSVLTQALAANSPSTPPTPAPGFCAVDVTLTDSLLSKYTLLPLVNNTINTPSPFYSSRMTVTLVCAGPLSADGSNPLLQIGVGANISPLLGGISGISANVTNTSKEATMTCTTNNGDIAGTIDLSGINSWRVGSTTMSVGPPLGALTKQIVAGNVCTFTLTPTLNFYTNGDVFNTNISSTQQLTDGNAGSSFIYKSFVKEGSALSSAFSANGGSNRSFSSVSAAGINAFTVSAIQTKTCKVSNAVNQLLTYALPTLDAQTAALVNNTGAGLRNFSIDLSGCSDFAGFNTITGTFAYTAPTGADVDATWIENTAPDSPAQNVYTMLLDANKSAIANGVAIPLTKNGSTSVWAQYVSRRGTTLSPGRVFGSATLTLNYN